MERGREMSCIRERDPSAEVRKRSASDGNFCPKKVKLQYHWAIASMRETDCDGESFHAVCSMSSLASPLMQPISNAN